MSKLKLILIMCLSATACGDWQYTNIADSDVLMSTERVKDGDSFVARSLDRSKVEVRLFGIDAPERNQPFANNSKKLAEQLLNGKQLRVHMVEKDRYGRWVSWVYIDGETTSVNEYLVEQGAAWVYRRYTEDSRLLSKEKQAIEAGRGLWSLPAEKRIAPWDWRKKQSR